jgi:predicted nucleic acid-binding protein
MAAMQKHPLVAIDTNFPLMLAEKNDLALEALSVVCERMRPAEILIPPTVMIELMYHAKKSTDLKLRNSAQNALSNLLSHRPFRFVSLNSTQEAIAAKAAGRISSTGLIPSEERNDAIIIAESAVLNAILLVSNDSHLLSVDHRRLGLLFRELDLPVPLIVSPREIVQKFYH